MAIRLNKSQKIGGVDYPNGIAIIGLDKTVEDVASQGGAATPVNLSLVDSASTAAYFVPKPTGDATADFKTLADFSAAMPAGAVIQFPKSAAYTVAAGWQIVKPGQRWLGNGATIQRAAQVVATTTTPVLAGTTYIGLSSVAGQYPGKFISVFGVNGAAAACRYNYITRVTGVDANGVFVEPLINSIIRVSDSVGAQTIVAGATLHDAGWMLGNNYEAVRAYLAWGGSEAAFWATQVPSDVTFQDLILSGNAAAFLTGQRWEVLSEMSSVVHDLKAYGIQLLNCAGEGLLLSGKKLQLDRIGAVGINGNPIHLSAFSANYGCHDTLCTAPNLDDFCKVDIGHSDGAFVASNNIYGAKIRDGIIRNSIKAGLGAWDTVDNTGLDCSGMTFENLQGGAWTAKAASAKNSQLLDFSIERNIVKNCGKSQIGGDYSQGANNSTAKNFRCNRNTFYDSTLFATSFVGGEIIGNEAYMTVASAMFTPDGGGNLPNGKVFDFPSHSGTEIAGNRVYMPAYVGSAVSANAASYGIHVYGQSVDALKNVRYHDNYTFGGMVGQFVEGGQGGMVSHDNSSEDAAVMGYVASIGAAQKTLDSHNNVVRLSTGNSTLNGAGISGGHRAIVYSNGSTTAWLMANKDRAEVLAQAGGSYVIGMALASGRIKGDGCHAQMYAGNTRPWEFSAGITGAPATNVAYWENATRNVSDSGAGAPAGVTLTNNRLLP